MMWLTKWSLGHQAILDGREPDGLSYMKLIKVLSYNWDAQRKALGFE